MLLPTIDTSFTLPRGVVAGTVLTGACVLLLAVGHCAAPTVPRDAIEPLPAHLCDSAPAWVQEVDDAWVTAAMLDLPATWTTGDCPLVLSTPSGLVPAAAGRTAIALSTGQDAADNVARCNRGPGMNTITVPAQPPDKAAEVLAHELAHCLGGWSHAEGPLGLPAPRGHLMHPTASQMGWDTRGMQ